MCSLKGTDSFMRIPARNSGLYTGWTHAVVCSLAWSWPSALTHPQPWPTSPPYFTVQRVQVTSVIWAVMYEYFSCVHKWGTSRDYCTPWLWYNKWIVIPWSGAMLERTRLQWSVSSDLVRSMNCGWGFEWSAHRSKTINHFVLRWWMRAVVKATPCCTRFLVHRLHQFQQKYIFLTIIFSAPAQMLSSPLLYSGQPRGSRR